MTASGASADGPTQVGERPFGRSARRVARIGFGCGPTGGLIIGAPLAERCAVVGRALERGITLFDTAPVYGAGRSEANLGETLRALGASPAVATKVVLMEEDLADIGAAIERSVARSLERLQTDRVAMLHLHNRIGARRAAHPDIGVGALLSEADVLGPNGVVEAFARLKRAGAAELFGCCAYGGEMPSVRRVVDAGFFDGVIVNYSLLNPSALAGTAPGTTDPDYRRIGDHAARRGLGLVALRILEGGLLARDDGFPGVAELNALVAAHGCSLREAAIRFALSSDAVSTALVGISTLEQVDEAADHAALGPLPPDLLHALETLFSRAAPPGGGRDGG